MNEAKKTQQQSEVLPNARAGSFVKNMASFSFWSVLVTPLVCFGSLLALQNQIGPIAHWAREIVSLLSAIGIVIGFVLGLVALIKNSRHFSKNIFVRSLLGVAGNGLLICLAVILVWFFLRTYNTQLSSLTLTPADRAAQLYSRSVISFHNQRKLINRFASFQMGDTNIAVDALNIVIQKQQALTKVFYTAVQPLNTMHVLDMSSATKAEDLQPRKELLRRFIEVNKQLSQFLTNAEQVYKGELIARGVSPILIESMVQRFHDGWQEGLSSHSPSGLVEANDRWAQDELGALSLLETNWDSWSYDASQKKTVFNDDSLRKEFNRLIQEINRFTEERKRLQQEVLSKNNP